MLRVFNSWDPMKRLQLLRWSGSVLSPRLSNSSSTRQFFLTVIRQQSSSSAPLLSESEQNIDNDFSNIQGSSQNPSMPSPPQEAALRSAKLSALHSRLSLPERLPLQTLARTLVDHSADPSLQFNNHSLSVLGTHLLSYYTSEHIISTYPRLPMGVIWASMWAYIGPKALATISKEWGIEHAAEPGSEVDPGLLQFKRLPPGSKPSDSERGGRPMKRGISGRIVYDNMFGEARQLDPKFSSEGVTMTHATATFVQALIGAIYLHCGRPVVKEFFKEHFMSRQLPIADLFSFSQPTRDLSKLCAREAFEPPVAKIISETGRHSRHPVFVVGIYSGNDQLGEGSGASLSEARFRAAAAALKGWYLYSPLNVRVPSSTEEIDATPWEPAMVDPGEIIV
ncbi:54S ribosomal protein L3 mitochondrial [Ophidiomyces ophidiicola]|nr:54S ribosomal protein L3 mitochondrial [Ophidiomyces ophidiicola]KAI1927319.1 54S ribosomal protein L3 mitochondrial [Ophidiomyces ophidiicola]KAI1964453.1 54S ribosomal protein L3 mitochondrial [Ophidiomyces ophidiicola]KAI2034621.1 54S ribosomal protein L3 mitochondrial [Ophidiomyces ophidiicola]KAI2093026.1 54S ribosomal protein L3 mitochondrial [Ophidiomyces ophidiicola]